MSAVTQMDLAGRSSTVNSTPSRTRPSSGRSAGGTTRAVYAPAGIRIAPGSSTLRRTASPAPAPSASARNDSMICRTAASDASWLARRTRIVAGIVYVISDRSAPARRTASSTRAPSRFRLSPAAGAAPSDTSPNAAAAPSSSATSPSRTTAPTAVTSAGTLMRPVAAIAALKKIGTTRTPASIALRGGTGAPPRRARSSRARVQPSGGRVGLRVARGARTASRGGAPVPPPRHDLADDRIGSPQHLVRGLNRLRRDLIRPLPRDQRHQLLDDAHVRVLEEPLQQRAAVLLPRRAHLRRARRLRLLKQVLAERAQPRRVGEARGLDLPHLRRGRLAGQDRAHDAVAADRDVLGAARDRDRGLERDALGRHHARLVVELEGPRTRKGRRAVGQRHLEEARALDGHVERVAGLRVVALHVDPLDGRRPRAESHLDAGRRLRAVGGGRPRGPDRLLA